MDVTRLPDKHRAVLLLGPTGSGKTPLGELIERRGLWGAKCSHFDFGANLRAAVHRDRVDETTCRDPGFLSRQDVEFLRQVLASGALLEDERFPIAQRILLSFIARRGADQNTWLVLNGLPRHAGQAQAIDEILSVEAVVHLDCSGRTIFERIRSNVGGDRAGRADDSLDAVRRKLVLFNRRTAPLAEHYNRREARIITVNVTSETTAEEMWKVVNRS